MAEKGGQAGNDNYLRGAIFNDALRRAVAQDDGKRIREAAEKLLDLAAEGTPWAVRELADRTDGKAMQAVALSGELKTRRAEDLTDDELAAIAAAITTNSRK